MLANLADGSKTPILPAATLKEIGYALAIYPAMTNLEAAAAKQRALRHLKTQGLSQVSEVPMFDLMEFCHLIGFEDVWVFERQWAGQA